MSATRNELHHVLGSHDGEQKRFEVPVECGDEDRAPRAHQRRKGRDHLRGIGHVLEHLHAGDDIEASGFGCRDGLRRDHAVVDLEFLFHRVQTGHLDHPRREVYCSHFRSGAGEGLRQQTSTTTDIEYSCAREGGALRDEAGANRI